MWSSDAVYVEFGSRTETVSTASSLPLVIVKLLVNEERLFAIYSGL